MFRPPHTADQPAKGCRALGDRPVTLSGTHPDPIESGCVLGDPQLRHLHRVCGPAIMPFTSPTMTVRIAPPAPPPPPSWPTMDPTSRPPLAAAPAIAGISACRICPPPTPPMAPAMVLPRLPRL